MTNYKLQDLDEGWEFKILRSKTGMFKSTRKFESVLKEESRGGWVLVEKFDDHRIRLKRPVGTKVVEDGFANPYDPYRTHVGLTEAKIGLIVFGGCLAMVGVITISALCLG